MDVSRTIRDMTKDQFKEFLEDMKENTRKEIRNFLEVQAEEFANVLKEDKDVFSNYKIELDTTVEDDRVDVYVYVTAETTPDAPELVDFEFDFYLKQFKLQSTCVVRTPNDSSGEAKEMPLEEGVEVMMKQLIYLKNF